MTATAISVRPLAPGEVLALLEELAGLRISVFRAFPYLYDGDMAYERRYLQTYLEAEGAFIAGAFDGERLVGASTAAPLGEHKAEFAGPFAEHGLDPDAFFYFGESVLLQAYRGRGIGVAFFDHREAEACRQGFSQCLFSAVIRPDNHPSRPAGHQPLDAFWRKRGYERLDGLKTRFAWKDIGDTEETEKPMEYWAKTVG